MERRHFLAASGAMGMSVAGSVHAQETQQPLAQRIRIATTAGPDAKKIEAWYTQYLGYKTRESGKVSAEMAKSWGTPKAAGRAYVLMSSDGSPDVYLRAVETDAVAGYEPMTTWGWNSWEIIIDDIDAVNAKMKASPFKIIGPPAPLKSTASIHAMQVIGPASEVLYLTTETADRTKSRLPIPHSLVDRPFIMVVAHGDIEKLRDFYADAFQMARQPINNTSVDIISRAQGLPLDSPRTISLLALAAHGNMMELDGYTGGKGVRPRADGQLPPGNAMATFAVTSLDAIKVPFLAPPMKLPGAAYGGKRSATIMGPGGEPLELIEA